MMSLGSLRLIKNTSKLSQCIKFVKVVCTNLEACEFYPVGLMQPQYITVHYVVISLNEAQMVNPST